MYVHVCFLTIPSSEMWWKTRALRILYSFVYLIFSEHHVSSTVLGTGDKAVNTTKKSLLSLRSSTGDIFYISTVQENKAGEGGQKRTANGWRGRRESGCPLGYFRWWMKQSELEWMKQSEPNLGLNSIIITYSLSDLSELVSSSCLHECIWCLLIFFILLLLLLLFFCS